ncbi:MAG TPA: OmpA family protein [Pyrinomonadaceae bacterium]|nr:OmpA family protein [Pyrinomonadaceae bacterium]
MSDSKNNPGPPPDDFSKTVPNVRLPEDPGAVDWDKTNYNLPKQPAGDEWGKTVTNIKPIDTGSSPDYGKTMYPGSQDPPEADWGATRPGIRTPDTDFSDVRGGGEPTYDKTTPYFQLPEADRQKYQNLPPTPTEQAAQDAKEKKAAGGIPGWVWAAAGIFAMFLFAMLVLLVVYLFFIRDASYTVLVRSAPPGSHFFVDGRPWGLSSEDGTKVLKPLGAGIRKITITHPTYECEPATADLKDGIDPPALIAQCKAMAVKQGENCGTFNPGEFDKAERCYNQALDALPEGFSDEALVNALNILIINFDTNKYDVPPQRLAALQKGAGFIKKLQEREPAIILEVGGHTDSDGSAAHNQGLSENRATAVRDVLVRYGVNAAGLQTKGYGMTQPKFDNNTEQGKFLNRRIQYSVVKR